MSKARAKGLLPYQLIPKILKRTALIFLIGLFLNAFPHHFDFATLRILGVLQRIAICYCVSALLFLTTRLRTQALLFVAILIGYWLLITLLSPPNYGEANNFAAAFDRFFITANHLYLKTSDPEGLLSTLPAIATVLLGNLTGALLLSASSQSQKATQMGLAGLILTLMGAAWGVYFPINKTLWTSSYVLWTGGWALLILAGFYWLIEIKGHKKWSIGLEIFGVNALAAYVLHVFFLKVQFMFTVSLPNHTSENGKQFLCDTLFGWASPHNASLFYALSYTLLWFLVLLVLYRKQIIIRL